MRDRTGVRPVSAIVWLPSDKIGRHRANDIHALKIQKRFYGLYRSGCQQASVKPYSTQHFLTAVNLSKGAGITETRNSVIFDGSVYDLTSYVSLKLSKKHTDLTMLQVNNNGGTVSTPNGTSKPEGIDTHFMHDQLVQLFTGNAGSDITLAVNRLNIDPAVLEAQKVCLRNIFMVGKLDHRNSAQVIGSSHKLANICLLSVVSICTLYTARSVNIYGCDHWVQVCSGDALHSSPSLL